MFQRTYQNNPTKGGEPAIMRKLLLFSALLITALAFAALPAFASTHPPCQWVQVDADNNPDTPPISVYGYWADLNGTQALIVCDPKTGEPVQDQDGNGIAYVNDGEYVQVEKQVLDHYETKQVLDWDHPKEVKPFQVTVFAPNVPLTLTYNLQDINAHGGLWLASTGDCVSWGYSAGDARLLTNNPDDWLIVAAVTNPNPFPATGVVDLHLFGKLTSSSSRPISKCLTLALGPNETKYVLLNRGNPTATGHYGVFAYETSGRENGSYRRGYSLGYFYSRDVYGSGDDFPDRLKPAKGFYLADPNWHIYPQNVWPMRFGVSVEGGFYGAWWEGYVWMDESGQFHAEPMHSSSPSTYQWWVDHVGLVEKWFNSHKITDIPLVCWYGGDPRTVDGAYFYDCRPAAYWWPDTQGAFASWTEQMGPVLVAPRWETFSYVPWWPQVAQWVPAREENINTRYWVGKHTVWCGPEVPPWLPVVKARLCFVHRYSWVPVDGDTGVLKEDVVPGYEVWVSSETAPRLYFNNLLKKITATRYHYLESYYINTGYGGSGPYLKYLVTTWEYTPGAGWTKLSERQESYWWESSPEEKTWGRWVNFWPCLNQSPDVWDVRVDYTRVLGSNNPGALNGTFTGSNNLLHLYDRSADAVRGALFNLYTVQLTDSGYYPVNLRPAVANLSAPGADVTVPAVRVQPQTTAPVWQQDYTASVRVARLPWEDPGAALNAILSAVRQGLGGTEAAFVWDGWYGAQTTRFVLDPDIPCGWAANAGGEVQPVTWIKGFGSVFWNSTGRTLGTPESLWSRYSYFHMDYVALPDDIFLNQAAKARSWTIRPLKGNRVDNWPFIDPWPVRYWDAQSWSWQIQE